MIFDDFDNNDMPNNVPLPRKINNTSLKFETSLDNEFLNKDEKFSGGSRKRLFEVFQVQLNERYFQMPNQRKKPVELELASPESKAKSGHDNFELRVKEFCDAEPQCGKLSLELSKECSAKQALMNLEAMKEDTFSSESNSSRDGSQASGSHGKEVPRISIRDARTIGSFGVRRRNISNFFQTKSRNRTLKKRYKKFNLSNAHEKLVAYSIDDLRPGCLHSGPVLRRIMSLENLISRHQRVESLGSLMSLDNLEERDKQRLGASGSFCFLCQKEFALRNFIAKTLTCGHLFHQQCLENWVSHAKHNKKQITCPECEQVL